MKYTYIVSWVLQTFVSTPCPDANKTDAYGRQVGFGYGCAVMHGRYVDDVKSRSFTDRCEAFSFLKDAPRGSIDSVKIK